MPDDQKDFVSMLLEQIQGTNASPGAIQELAKAAQADPLSGVEPDRYSYKLARTIEREQRERYEAELRADREEAAKREAARAQMQALQNSYNQVLNNQALPVANGMGQNGVNAWWFGNPSLSSGIARTYAAAPSTFSFAQNPVPQSAKSKPAPALETVKNEKRSILLDGDI